MGGQGKEGGEGGEEDKEEFEEDLWENYFQKFVVQNSVFQEIK